jgi:hypothetical protein
LLQPIGLFDFRNGRNRIGKLHFRSGRCPIWFNRQFAIVRKTR